MHRALVRILLPLALTAASALSACGGGHHGPRDAHVGGQVEGSGQAQLLRDPTFRFGVREIGVLPGTRPVSELGRAIGRRMRELTVAAGRLAPGSFAPGAYRRMLIRRGRLSQAAFRRRFHEGPRELCDRLGALTGQLEWLLDEGAHPEPELARSVLAGFGTGGSDVEPARAEPANRIAVVRDLLDQLLPEAGAVQCATAFRSSNNFVTALYRKN